ncbi:DUF5799 family protein [Halobium palmae]|uniref:DUF5799 family protein n=1 Tax=Halobium palmae TaxID=1776492 RepID=A0ABD5S1N7_9EURY
MSDWTDAIVGDRMAVDRAFNDRLQGSRFSNQEWGLIMTATEFDIEHADDPERARIVANTEKLPQIIPELDNVRSQMQSMGGGGGGSGGGSSGGGLFDSVKSAFGLGSSDGVDDEELEAAERLTQEYADELQRHLEEKGKWEQVRIAYQE